MSAFRRDCPSSTDGRSSAQSENKAEAAASSFSLPPLRCLDPLQRLSNHAVHGRRLSAQLPSAALPPISQHYPQLPGISHYQSTSSAYGFGVHYLAPGNPAIQMNVLPHTSLLPIAPSDSPRFVSGGRHKKEVKRRTKTGCLTCRKRRIKVSRFQRGCKVVEVPCSWSKPRDCGFRAPKSCRMHLGTKFWRPA
jgi:hypothetical protein